MFDIHQMCPWYLLSYIWFGVWLFCLILLQVDQISVRSAHAHCYLLFKLIFSVYLRWSKSITLHKTHLCLFIRDNLSKSKNSTLMYAYTQMPRHGRVKSQSIVVKRSSNTIRLTFSLLNCLRDLTCVFYKNFFVECYYAKPLSNIVYVTIMIRRDPRVSIIVKGSVVHLLVS